MWWFQQLVVKAVSLAIARDGASGGVVRTVIVSFFSKHKLCDLHTFRLLRILKFCSCKLTDKLRRSDQELLPWRSAASMVRGAGTKRKFVGHTEPVVQSSSDEHVTLGWDLRGSSYMRTLGCHSNFVHLLCMILDGL